MYSNPRKELSDQKLKGALSSSSQLASNLQKKEMEEHPRCQTKKMTLSAKLQIIQMASERLWEATPKEVHSREDQVVQVEN